MDESTSKCGRGWRSSSRSQSRSVANSTGGSAARRWLLGRFDVAGDVGRFYVGLGEDFGRGRQCVAIGRVGGIVRVSRCRFRIQQIGANHLTGIFGLARPVCQARRYRIGRRPARAAKSAQARMRSFKFLGRMGIGERAEQSHVEQANGRVLRIPAGERRLRQRNILPSASTEIPALRAFPGSAGTRS